MAGKPPTDFASASLVALVVKSAVAADPGLLPPGFTAPDPMHEATLPASEKRALLDYIYDKGGAGPLLLVGNNLDPAGSPLIATLAKAPGPDVLIDKWTRLERYGHAVNRTDIRRDGEHALACRRWSEAAAPTAAENALIAGFLFGLVGLAGACQRSLTIDGQTAEVDDLASIGTLSQNGGLFRIAWKGWQSTPIEIRDEAPAGTAERLKTLLACDVGRNWNLAEVGRLMAKSGRTLQRELSGEGLTFSTALRGVRIAEATRLLREAKGASLAEIGYCCGYADQPHFQRDFRRALNMSPGDYRRVACT